MAARQGALAAGAARASGERAKRRSTPLIGAEPIVPAERIGCRDRAVRRAGGRAEGRGEEGGASTKAASEEGAPRRPARVKARRRESQAK